MWMIPSGIIHFVCHISSSWYESYWVRDMNQYVNHTEWYYSLCLPHLEFVIWIISSSWHESICEWYRVILFTLSATSRVRDMNHIEFVTWINMWIIPSDTIHFVCHISSSWYESYRVRDMNQYVNDTEWYYSLCLPYIEFVTDENQKRSTLHPMWFTRYHSLTNHELDIINSIVTNSISFTHQSRTRYHSLTSHELDIIHSSVTNSISFTHQSRTRYHSRCE